MQARSPSMLLPALLGSLLLLPGQGLQPTRSAGEGVVELLAAYEAASSEHEKHRGQDETHPARAYWPRFEALADAGDGRALLWMCEHLGQAGLGTEQRRERGPRLFAPIFGEHGQADWIDAAYIALSRELWAFGPEQLAQVEAWCEAGIDAGQPEQVRAAATYAAASVELQRGWAGDRAAHERGIDAMIELVERHPGSELAQDAGRAASFNLEQLSRRDLETGPSPLEVRRRYADRIEPLARRGVGHARVWLFQNAGGLGLPHAEADALRLTLLEAMFRENAGDSFVQDRVVPELEVLAVELGPEALAPAMVALEAADADPDLILVPALHSYALGCLTAASTLDEERTAIARLEGLARRFPEHELGRDAAKLVTTLTRILPGRPAPDFEAQDVEGRPLRLSDSRGKVTVLFFWGFW